MIDAVEFVSNQRYFFAKKPACREKFFEHQKSTPPSRKWQPTNHYFFF